MHWYLRVLKKYAVFSGRARRKEFWYFMLINWIISIVLQFGAGVFDHSGQSIVIILYDLYALGILIPSLAVTFRRLHDTGQSGWWASIAFLIGLILNINDIFPLGNAILIPVILIGILAGVMVIIIAVYDSQPGSNKYGPNPKGTDA